MPKFDATLVEPMTYDFTGFGQPGVEGTIPEPSSERIETFLAVMREVMPIKEDTDDDGKTISVLDMDAIEEKFGEDPDEAMALVDAACAEVCQNTPTAEQIAALPYRAHRMFWGWLFGTLMSPEA